MPAKKKAVAKKPAAAASAPAPAAPAAADSPLVFVGNAFSATADVAHGKAHFVAMLLPVIAGIIYIVRHRNDKTRIKPRRNLLAALAITFLFTTLASRDILGKTVSVYLLALSSFFFVTVIFWTVSCLIMRNEKEKSAAIEPTALNQAENL